MSSSQAQKNTKSLTTNDKKATKLTSSIKNVSEEKNEQPQKISYPQTINMASDFVDNDLEARIEALRSRYKQAQTSSRSQSRINKELPETNISVDKANLTLPAKNPKDQDKSKLNSTDQIESPKEPLKGKSKGQKRILAMSASSKSEASKSPQKTSPAKRRPANPPAIEPSKVKPSLSTSKDPETLENDDIDTSNIEGIDPVAYSQRLKNKIAVANKRDESRLKLENSIKKTLQAKKDVHDAVKIEKESIRDKMHENSHMEFELNKKKKLLVK
jgi:hypothetical protein